MKRRKLFTLAAATAGFTVLPGIAQAREGIDTGLDADGAGDLAYLESAFERHRGGYNGRPPEADLGEMREVLTLLAAVLRRPRPARDRTDLARTAAGISGLVAIVQHDRGDQADAHRWFTTAAKAARESGDRRMTAWVLGRHALVGLNYGAPGQAARIAAQARREAGAHPSSAAALAAAVSARALAALGAGRGQAADTEGQAPPPDLVGAARGAALHLRQDPGACAPERGVGALHAVQVPAAQAPAVHGSGSSLSQERRRCGPT
ncbi:hypothetical protein [Streptomyces sp. NBC_00826]|uniref:hypothetical protein n=1 Tax=Streptomyces sp. NBC_00826 TaxID=2975845 RepID=UPI002F913847|nr:hypothetical protein OG832_45620 [Streptomyces sp. NBC_00826]